MLNCIIVDDDEGATRLIKECVMRTGFFNLAATCNGVAKAIQIMKEQVIDIILLDVEMPEINGIEFLKNFNPLPQVILISSSKEYAFEAFNYNVTDYLLKPIEYPKFLKAAVKAKELFEMGTAPISKVEAIFVKEESRLIQINTKDINWIEALADYVLIYTGAKRFTVHSTMKAIENKLNAKEFVRIHRSYIVRIDQIKTIENHNLVIGDKVLPIGLSYKDHLYKNLNLL
jgi:DNA-binding LytR/AlgR family response regulator